MELFKQRGIAGVSEAGVKVLSDKVKESSELGVSGVLGSCFVPWLILVRKERISSGVREVNSRSPKAEVRADRRKW